MLGVIGDLVQDVVVWQHEEIRPATDTDCEVHLTRGGSAANVAAFAGPRFPTRFIGKVGDDLGGHVVRADLERRGVDVRLQLGGTTGTIVVLIDPSGERSMFPSRGASAELTAIDPAWLDGLRVLHVTAYSFASGSTPGSVLDAVARVRAAGGRISLDASSVGLIEQLGRSAFDELLTVISPDYLTANAAECAALDLVADGGAGPGLRRLPETTLIARNGSSPTRVFRGSSELASVPVTPVEGVRDFTGAGDAFNAGFLIHTLSTGFDPVESVAAGHRLAARVLGQPGAAEG